MAAASPVTLTHDSILSMLADTAGPVPEDVISAVACGMYDDALSRLIARERAKAGRGLEGAF
jgi:hypothetical protein